MKPLTLPIALTLLGMITQAPSVGAIEISANQSGSESSVILQEQGVLDTDAPTLESDGSFYRVYDFEGTAGQTVQITLESQDFDAYLILLDANSQKLSENDDVDSSTTNAQVSLTLPQTGSYHVIANSYGAGERGAFTLTVRAVGQSSESAQSPQQSCPEDSYEAGNYAQVTTRDGSDLRVRNAPNGSVIGAIPNGWQVIVQQTDATGSWTRVTSQYGEEYGEIEFGSAPNFRAGWVSTAYLRNLGHFCDKPSNPVSLVQPDLFGQREVMVAEDWIARGDRLAQLSRNHAR